MHVGILRLAPYKKNSSFVFTRLFLDSTFQTPTHTKKSSFDFDLEKVPVLGLHSLVETTATGVFASPEIALWEGDLDSSTVFALHNHQHELY
jgi:hypothetical protein